MTFSDMASVYRSIGKAKKCTFIFCADHGVAEMNVSAYPQATTVSMVKNYLLNQGGAANSFARFANSELVVVDVGVNADLSKIPGLVDKKIAYGTKNIAEGAAMTKAQARKSIKIGRELAKKAIKAGFNCFLIGEMGIANTTVASAITAAFFNADPRKVTGRGSNISDTRLRNKIKVVREALRKNQPDPDDIIDILAKVGGFEFGAMAGVILEAAENDCVAILDGFNTSVAALIADAINPHAKTRVIASHVGREPGHMGILAYLELAPMFSLDLALGEAIGSSIASRILDRLVYIYVCDPEDDFHGDVDEFKDDEPDEAAILTEMLEQMGLSDLPDFENFEDVENYLEENFGDAVQINEVDLDFQLADDQRLESFTPPFSAEQFNIPRSYPMMVKFMASQEDLISATDKTFNFYLQTMPKLHFRAMDDCKDYLNNLTKPQNGLGFLEDIAVQLAGITNEKLPSNNLRHAALAFTNSDNAPPPGREAYRPHRRGRRRQVVMDFSLTARTFAMKLFAGIVDDKADPTVAFNFGRNIAEEISFSIPIIAITELSDWDMDRIDEKFFKALLTKDLELKVPPEEFLNYVPKKFRCLTSAIIGAIVAAAHNSTLVVIDCGAVEIIARYLEKICPEVRPFLLYATKLIAYEFDDPTVRIGMDGEVSCMGVEIVEAALTALNEMKTFRETDVEVALDGAGKGVQRKNFGTEKKGK